MLILTDEFLVSKYFFMKWSIFLDWALSLLLWSVINLKAFLMQYLVIYSLVFLSLRNLGSSMLNTSCKWGARRRWLASLIRVSSGSLLFSTKYSITILQLMNICTVFWTHREAELGWLAPDAASVWALQSSLCDHCSSVWELTKVHYADCSILDQWTAKKTVRLTYSHYEGVWNPIVLHQHRAIYGARYLVGGRSKEMMSVLVIGEEDPLNYWDLYAYFNIIKISIYLNMMHTRQTFLLFSENSNFLIV